MTSRRLTELTGLAVSRMYREKAKRGDFVYVNTGTPEELDAWVGEVMATLTSDDPSPKAES